MPRLDPGQQPAWGPLNAWRAHTLLPTPPEVHFRQQVTGFKVAGCGLDLDSMEDWWVEFWREHHGPLDMVTCTGCAAFVAQMVLEGTWLA